MYIELLSIVPAIGVIVSVVIVVVGGGDGVGGVLVISNWIFGEMRESLILCLIS